MKGPKGLTDERSTFVIDSYLQDNAFTEVKGEASFKQGMWKGYYLSIEGVRKGCLFRE